jgi:hypothetical protein
LSQTKGELGEDLKRVKDRYDEALNIHKNIKALEAGQEN